MNATNSKTVGRSWVAKFPNSLKPEKRAFLKDATFASLLGALAFLLAGQEAKATTNVIQNGS
ncbi:MAG: hypothetical protein WCP22_11570, partial [Chlamydiota bacterium]